LFKILTCKNLRKKSWVIVRATTVASRAIFLGIAKSHAVAAVAAADSAAVAVVEDP